MLPLVKEKLGTLIHKQNFSHDFVLNFINYNIIIVHVGYITIETKEVVRIRYNGFRFPDSYAGEGFCTRVLVRKKKPFTHNNGQFFYFNSTVHKNVSYT